MWKETGYQKKGKSKWYVNTEEYERKDKNSALQNASNIKEKITNQQ